MSKKINSQSVNNVAASAQVANKMMTVYGIEAIERTDMQDVEGLDFSKLNKALRDAIQACHGLAQAIKVMDGLMSLPLTYDDEDTTLGALLKKCGFMVGSQNMSVKALLNGWRFKSEAGRCQIWRNVPGTIPAENINEQSETKGTNKKHDNARVYTWSEKQQKWNAVSMFKLVDVDDNKWSVEMILRGVVQSAFPERMKKTALKSVEKWDKTEEVFRFQHRMDKGGMTNKAIKAKKQDVQF